jgi:hypothetical protein
MFAVVRWATAKGLKDKTPPNSKAAITHLRRIGPPWVPSSAAFETLGVHDQN